MGLSRFSIKKGTVVSRFSCVIWAIGELIFPRNVDSNFTLVYQVIKLESSRAYVINCHFEQQQLISSSAEEMFD